MAGSQSPHHASQPRLRASYIKYWVIFLIGLYFATLLYIRSHPSQHHDAAPGDTHALRRYIRPEGSSSRSSSRSSNSRGRDDSQQQQAEEEQERRHTPNEEGPAAARFESQPQEEEKKEEEDLEEQEGDLTLKHKSALPAFAADDSEFIFGSLIERAFDSWDLHLTTFMLCHYMLEPSTSTSGMGVERAHPLMRDKWKRAVQKFMDAAYFPSGRRLATPQFFCRISNSATSPAYTVEGSFVPNRLTSDSNANRRMDILRCKMEGAQGAYSTLAGPGSREFVHVEVTRGAGADAVSLVNFTVPWDARRTGYLLSHPPGASQLDMWRGASSSSSYSSSSSSGQGDDASAQNEQGQALPNAATNSIVHICVPGTRQYPSKRTLPLFLEFVAHHVLLGADHIHLPVLLGWGSPHMALFTDVFRSYIRQGKLSIGSQAGDGVDMVSSLAGMTWNKNAIKIFQANACLYSTKGLADYLMVIDIDEFFVPRFKSGLSSIIDVIRAVEAPKAITPPESPQVLEEIKDSWQGGRGLADGEAHPQCYLKLTSEVYANRRTGSFVEPAHPWMGQRFAHGAETTNALKVFRYRYHKPILPTAKIFQAGLNTGGACRLDPGWTTCGSSPAMAHGSSDFCGDGTGEPRRMGKMKGGMSFDFRGEHNFDEIVTERDARLVNPDHEAVLHHFLLYHENLAASPDTAHNHSDYSQHFFSRVRQELRARNLELLVLMPDDVSKPPTSDEKWDKFFSKEEVEHAAAFNSIKEALHVPRGHIDPAMPQNFSTRHLQTGHTIVSLPYFAVDFSEYVLGAMIERVSDSFDLYLTVFFLCHGLLEPKVGLSAVSGEKLNKEVLDVWKKAMRIMETTKYYDNGMREETPAFYCKITHAEGGNHKSYLVRGSWVPSRLTPDSNSNRRTDIFRCKMEDAETAYRLFARSGEHVSVEIVRDTSSLLAFRVPWSTRATGFMLDAPGYASRLDPWKGYDPKNHGKWTHDRLYMCVPGLETVPSKTTLPLYLEFIQHHLLLGVQHFFVAALFNWASPHMRLFLRVFDSYVQEGSLSFSSSSGDGFDLVYSTAGLQWGRDNVKNFQVNMCTYLSKGMADYVGIWDFDEHFIPMGNNSNILDVIGKIESPRPIPYLHGGMTNVEVYPHWLGPQRRGMADKDGHPLCYMILNAVVTLFAQAHTAVDPLHPWLGERFSHGAERLGHGLGFKKSIRPTRTIFQGGLHLAGACRLPHPWNGCEKETTDFCYTEGPKRGQVFRLTKFPNGTAINFNLNHRFDEITLEQDAYTIDSKTEAVINHLQYHRFWFGASAESLEVKSPYTSRYFPRVFAELDKRDLALPISLPELQQKPFPLPDHDWVDLLSIHKEITSAAPSGAGGPGGDAEQLIMPTFTAQLPNFANDKSEMFLASIIEREAQSFTLHLTTFLLSHPMIEPKEDGTQALRVRNSSLAAWRTAIVKFKQAQYLPNGRRRRSPKFYCKISNSKGEAPYLVEGSFVPNRLTPDIGANRRLDTLRCKMERSKEAYMSLARDKSKAVQVEIFREAQSLVSFSVPWSSRANGDMLQGGSMESAPPTAAASASSSDSAAEAPKMALQSSRLDPWSGFDRDAPGSWSMDRFHMCVPGIESPPAKKNIPIYLEFLQHHVNMGVAHVHLTALFTWKSVHMQRLMRVLRFFIDDGLVSLTSHTSDGQDYLYSFQGLSWMRDNIKINQVNMCTYLAKGVTDYVGIWDIDEFFIPKGRFGNILDVISSLEAPAPSSPEEAEASTKRQLQQVKAFSESSARLKPHEKRELWQSTVANTPAGRGFASRDGHPFCYMQLNSQVIPNREAVSSVDMSRLWIGQMFAHGPEPSTSRLGQKFSFKKSIVPTRTMFQIGLHMSGACKLDRHWNGCGGESDEACYGTTGEAKREPNLDLQFQPFNAEQRFDEIVTDDDTRIVDTQSEAVLYHFMLYRFYHAASNASILLSKNDYSSNFFNATMQGLRRRNLDLLVDIPFDPPHVSVASDSWPNYNSVWAARKTDISLSEIMSASSPILAAANSGEQESQDKQR